MTKVHTIKKNITLIILYSSCLVFSLNIRTEANFTISISIASASFKGIIILLYISKLSLGLDEAQERLNFIYNNYMEIVIILLMFCK